MTNKERAAIIRSFFDKCLVDCDECPSSRVICNISNPVEAKQKFFNEVADILEGKPIKVKVRKHNEQI